MLKETLPVVSAAEESPVISYMEKRGSWRVISNTWNWVLETTKRFPQLHRNKTQLL